MSPTLKSPHRPLRIAIYHNLHSGGAKRVTAEHVARLSARHQVALFSLEDADHAFAAIESVRVKQHLYSYRPLPMLRTPLGRINPLVGLLNVQRMNRLAQHIAGEIDAGGYDVVLAHPCQMTQAPLVLRWLQTPSVYYCYELPRRFYETKPLRPYLHRRRFQRMLDQVDPLPGLMAAVMRRVDCVNAWAATQLGCISQQTQTDMKRVYHRVAEVCPPGISVPTIAPTPSSRERRVLSVGALTPNKGFDFIIQSLATFSLSARPPLSIISNYQEIDELRYLTQLAQQKQVRVEFLTRVPEEELWAWYGRVGCLAYAPVREPYGLAALEAMAVGTPVVGVAEGGVLETVQDRVTGLLAPREPMAFGTLVQQLLDNPGQAQLLGASASRYVRDHCTWERHLLQLEKLLYQASASQDRPHAPRD